MRPGLIYASWLCLMLPLTACETSPAGEYQRTVEVERESFVYKAPAAEIYRQAVALLAERGHPLPTAPVVVDATVESPWIPPGGGDQRRFLLRIIRADRDRHLVHLTGQARAADGHIYSSFRWTDLEWELIQRVEPARAIDIADKANRAANDVHRRNNARAR
jgi:hypothetical protein